LPFQLAERGEFPALEFLDPPLANLMDRHRVEVVQLLAALLEGGDEVRLFENGKVLEASASALKTSSMVLTIGNQMVACQV
jgi:hypothetical protein